MNCFVCIRNSTSESNSWTSKWRRKPDKDTPGPPTADASGGGSSHRLGDGRVSRSPASLCRRPPGGQLYRDDPVRAQQRPKAATRKVKQSRKFAAWIFMDRSDTACSGPGPRTEAFLSAPAGPERNG